jgi:murein DD-endopeptidase MepM/ murein hydrolase activator NlpD
MIFPDLAKDRFGYINLNLEAIEWFQENNLDPKENNPFLDPKKCGALVAKLHKKFGVQHSYGGWLEDRSTLWRGSYLDQTERYYHLGVDFNVQAGTRVAACQDGYLMRTDSDSPEEYGWGSRVIMLLKDSPYYLVYAHLDKPLLQKSNVIKAGDILGVVGVSVNNGGWFPHLHVQAISLARYRRLLEDDFRGLDGYGHKPDISELALDYPDPMNFVSIK